MDEFFKAIFVLGIAVFIAAFISIGFIMAPLNIRPFSVGSYFGGSVAGGLFVAVICFVYWPRDNH